jgi:hypothetical protein
MAVGSSIAAVVDAAAAGVAGWLHSIRPELTSQHQLATA